MKMVLFNEIMHLVEWRLHLLEWSLSGCEWSYYPHNERSGGGTHEVAGHPLGLPPRL
jgi:hypothetical protein